MLAQRPWRTEASQGGSGWPITLAEVFSPVDKPTGRDRNGAAWRHFISQMCLSVREKLSQFHCFSNILMQAIWCHIFKKWIPA